MPARCSTIGQHAGAAGREQATDGWRLRAEDLDDLPGDPRVSRAPQPPAVTKNPPASAEVTDATRWQGERRRVLGDACDLARPPKRRDALHGRRGLMTARILPPRALTATGSVRDDPAVQREPHRGGGQCQVQLARPAPAANRRKRLVRAPGSRLAGGPLLSTR